MEDAKILDLYFARAESALEETRRQYGGRLFAMARNILHSNEDAEECVNDTLMRAWQSIPPTRPEFFGAYLAKILRNLCLNVWEKKKAARRGGGEINLMLDELTACAPAQETPERAFEGSQVTAAVNVFLARAEKTARVAFVLRYFHGESIAELCTRFQMSESKVKSILFRMRKKLRQHLEREGIAL